jgi:hypothetical protein
VPEYAARATYHRYGPMRFNDQADEAAVVAATEHAPRRVVLSAHSQGTIIAAAALLQLEDTAGLSLLSYGCPLDRLYARYFPAYFGGDTLQILLARLTTADATTTAGPHQARWRNLSRPTDPVGAAVFPPPPHDGPPAAGTGSVDVPVPIPVIIEPGDTVYPAIEAHSRYPREQRYADKLRELLTLT